VPEPHIYDDEPCWCMGECCSDIPLTERDLLLIERDTNMRRDDISVRTNAGRFMKQGPPVYEYREHHGDRLLFVLRFCFFLDKDTRLCHFYDQRAHICRKFVHEREKEKPTPNDIGDLGVGV